MDEIKLIEDRAQRMLDGMAVNRDAFARDVLRLCAATRRLQVSIHQQQRPKPSGRREDVGDIFSEVFGGRRHG